MNIETKIDRRIWDAIRNNIENRNFTGAIQDSIYFMSELIRERSGKEGDGASLIGAAFGGNDPALKVNNFKTESEKNIQKGIEHILRGIYQSIRNPRSHEKYSDTEDDAKSIILFINYLVKIIDSSKSQFNDNDFISRVIDPAFVNNIRYARMLVSDIPKKKAMDIFYGVFKEIENSEGKKIRYFFDALFEILSDEDKKEAYNTISNSLKRTSNTRYITNMIIIFEDIWVKIDEAARMRIENILIEDIKKGVIIPHTNILQNGALGTWVTSISNNFLLKNELISVLEHKLSSPIRPEQDYVFRYLGSIFCDILEKPSHKLQHLIIKGLTNGDGRFKDLVEYEFLPKGEKWSSPFNKYFDSFEAVPLPYDPLYDNVPF